MIVDIQYGQWETKKPEQIQRVRKIKLFNSKASDSNPEICIYYFDDLGNHCDRWIDLEDIRELYVTQD